MSAIKSANWELINTLPEPPGYPDDETARLIAFGEWPYIDNQEWFRELDREMTVQAKDLEPIPF